jgi:hypothetical protein
MRINATPAANRIIASFEDLGIVSRTLCAFPLTPPTESLPAIGRRHDGENDIEFRNIN